MTRRYPWVALLTVLVLLTTGVVLGWGWLLGIDRAVAAHLDDRPPPAVLTAWTVLTWGGAGPVVSSVGGVAAVVLARRRQWAAAAALAASMFAVFVCWGAMRLAVARPRPAGGLVGTDTAIGYPSGHATNSAAVAVLAVCVLGPLLRRRGRVLLAAGVALFALLIGVSRLVLEVHFASDVLAGWALGALVAGVVFTAVRTGVEHRAGTG